MKRYSTASCFATYLLPHVLFVTDFEERQRIARVCCLAWNIGLFPDTGDRERHIETVLGLIMDGADGPAPPGFRQGFEGELRMLVALKRDLFPWQLDTITRADLKHTPGADVLSVGDGKAVDRIELARSPAIAGLPFITQTLAQIHRDTMEQRRTLEQARTEPGLIEQVVTKDMVTAYCAQRADLRGYRRMLTVWCEALPELEMASAIERFLAAIEEIEADTKAVLGILAGALDAGQRA